MKTHILSTNALADIFATVESQDAQIRRVRAHPQTLRKVAQAMGQPGVKALRFTWDGWRWAADERAQPGDLWLHYERTDKHYRKCFKMRPHEEAAERPQDPRPLERVQAVQQKGRPAAAPVPPRKRAPGAGPRDALQLLWNVLGQVLHGGLNVSPMEKEVHDAVEAALLNSQCAPGQAVLAALRAVLKFAKNEDMAAKPEEWAAIIKNLD